MHTDITRRLYRLATEGPDGHAQIQQYDQHQTWTVHYPGSEIQINCANQDRHSTELHSLRVVQTRLDEVAASVEPVGLEPLAARAIRRLSYLEEPLAIWELEAGEKTVQLRSRPPEYEDDAIHYWEVVIQETPIAAGIETSAQISRYRWQPGMRERELLRYPATFSLLGRIAESLLLDE
jgi:hypothetical protein